jgi:hypothetical protein
MMCVNIHVNMKLLLVGSSEIEKIFFFSATSVYISVNTVHQHNTEYFICSIQVNYYSEWTIFLNISTFKMLH